MVAFSHVARVFLSESTSKSEQFIGFVFVPRALGARSYPVDVLLYVYGAAGNNGISGGPDSGVVLILPGDILA